jgi:hypothetical protein
MSNIDDGHLVASLCNSHFTSCLLHIVPGINSYASGQTVILDVFADTAQVKFTKLAILGAFTYVHSSY